MSGSPRFTSEGTRKMSRDNHDTHDIRSKRAAAVAVQRLIVKTLTIRQRRACAAVWAEGFTHAQNAAAQQLQTLQADEHNAEALYAATTQATASAKAALTTLPTGAPGRAQAAKVISASERTEQTARLALDVAKAALDAAQQKDAAAAT